MDKFGLIGHPIGHSLSPKLFTAAYGACYGYELIEEESFDAAFRRFLEEDYRAINVTAPFKQAAASASSLPSAEVSRLEAANILLKDGDEIRAFNSDYLGIRLWLSRISGGNKNLGVTVIGGGGAGRAAYLASCDSGFRSTLLHHDEIGNGASDDIIIFTLPRFCPGCGMLDCDILFEANYRNPVLGSHRGYVRGEEWLLAQAETGYAIMTGKNPDVQAMKSIIF